DRPPAQGGGAGLGVARGGRPGVRPYPATRPDRGGRQGGRSVGAARGGAGAHPPPREWWELNEQGTILRGERSGMTLRLGDPIAVRVGRVDPRRGRVDLDLAPAPGDGSGAGRGAKGAARGR
ncbi:MAG: hypothetical protein ACRDLF_07440, partial [Solirubrobacteraceae bacterium]